MQAFFHTITVLPNSHHTGVGNESLGLQVAVLQEDATSASLKRVAAVTTAAAVATAVAAVETAVAAVVAVAAAAVPAVAAVALEAVAVVKISLYTL